MKHPSESYVIIRVRINLHIASSTQTKGNLEDFLNLESHADAAERLDIPNRLEKARQKLHATLNPEYLESLVGTIGADPLGPARSMTRSDSVGEQQAA